MEASFRLSYAVLCGNLGISQNKGLPHTLRQVDGALVWATKLVTVELVSYTSDGRARRS